jgi:peptide/nickel transport system ATP-binding protein
VEGLSFSVERGEVVAVVGELASGKSVLRPSCGLPRRPVVAHGRILFEGGNLLDLDDRRMREICGRDIAMIFQEPMTSLNPLLSIGLQIAEPLKIHLGMNDAEADARTIELLKLVGF